MWKWELLLRAGLANRLAGFWLDERRLSDLRQREETAGAFGGAEVAVADDVVRRDFAGSFEVGD